MKERTLSRREFFVAGGVAASTLLAVDPLRAFTPRRVTSVDFHWYLDIYHP